MKNIFKSYMKAFLKAWVETLGTIMFLMIFTMLIFGMLATPLQLSLKASSVKKNTNLWQEQFQGITKLDDDFIYSYIWEEETLIFEYNDMNFELNQPTEQGWLQKETYDLIVEYVEDVVNEVSGSKYTLEEEKEELKKQETISALKSIIWYYTYYGNKNVINIFNTKQSPRPLEVGKIFTEDGQKEIANYGDFQNRNFNNYVILSVLEQLKNQSNDSFLYENFINSSIRMEKGTEEHFIYNMSNVEALSGNDQYNVNNVVLQSGRLPEKNNEIIISDAYAKNQNKKIGDEIILGVDIPFQNPAPTPKPLPFKIVGIGLKYSALTPINFSSFSDSIKNYGQVFLKNSFFTEIENAEGYTFSQLFTTDNMTANADLGFQFSYREETFVTKNSKSFNLNEIFTSNILSSNKRESNISILAPGTTIFKVPSEHSVIATLTNLYIITWIYVMIGAILFLLGFMFIVFVLKKEINNTRKQLGVFKSLGYKTSELTWVFSLKTFITMIIGIGIGYLLSFPFQIDSATKQFSTFVIFDYQTIYASPIFLIFLMLIVPILFAGLSYLIIFKFLNEGALALLTSGPKKSKADIIVLVLKIIFFPALIYSLFNWITLKILRKTNRGFTFRMQHAFVSAGKGKFALIMGLFLFSSFLFTLQLRAMPVIKNMIEGAYNIYTKDVNHYYSFKNVVPIKVKSNGISQDVTKENFGIKYKNIEKETVENYIRNSAEDKYRTTNNFSLLISGLSKARDQIINTPYWEENKEIISSAATITALVTPLNINIPKNQGLSNRISIPKEIPEYSILKVTPEQMGGIFLDDIGKLACLSPLGMNYKGSCDDVESVKKYFIDNMNNIIPRSQTKTDIKLSNILVNLLTTFSKMREGVNSLLSVNNVIFNGDSEALQTILPYHIKNNTEVDIEKSILRLIDTTNIIGGNTRAVVNLESVSEKAMKELQENNGNYINAVVSFRLSKILNKNVGDIFQITLGKDKKVDIRIAAINGNDTLLQDIYVDYSTFIKNINQVQSIDKDQLLFNSIISTKIASEGTIDLKDIAGSQRSFRYSRDTYTIASSQNKPWLGSILAPSINGNSLEKPTAVNFFMDSSVITLPILKSVINQVLGKMTKAMLMYILIDVVLLIILLIVIMNIIITDSINVITIMRSLGYKNAQINWMVMGKYVSGSIVSYIFAFLASLAVWSIIQGFVWQEFKVLIALPSLPWIPFVSAIILGAILYIGWTAAMLQIKKRPLTLLVS
ncbi:ABC transporter permease [Spiroplasma cantharicola]|uniref:ABC transporter permease n=1 Tax=Spiroplasma cantharicola TaxID=362837 RepID=A0A0M4K216_9MOLU|nr:ABC transporter permease [Spiroplasma cantharicola]ALD66737.1 ABC transporter permease [Spiroplasma cantharicola]